jgi:GNAT superfamily N-acetyltransferase
VRLRPPRPDEAQALRRGLTEGMQTYSSFAPPGWDPTRAGAPLEVIQEGLADPQRWFLLAEEDGAIVGHTAFHAGDQPGQAHLLALFVTPSRWGDGLAATLHAEALAEMRRRGFTTARLFTPARQQRARRFYEREGWRVHGDEHFEPKLGLDMVEYRRDLSAVA